MTGWFFLHSRPDRGILISITNSHSDAPKSATVSAKFASILSSGDEPILALTRTRDTTPDLPSSVEEQRGAAPKAGGRDCCTSRVVQHSQPGSVTFT
jgi:hypothetical protein